MTLAVVAPGLLTSVQDAGRFGARAFGVGVGGAADRHSLEIANLLVGNPPNAAVLEITLSGPTLRLQRATTIALCGAAIDAHADEVRLPGWRPIALPAGCVLTLGACRQGARAYLAVDGGIEVAEVLGSRSTDLRGGFGGHEGRALRVGDVLALGDASAPLEPTSRLHVAAWWIDADSDLDFAESIAVRVLPGSDATTPTDVLYTQEFLIDPASNRQGLRLRGTELKIADARERISEPVVPGTVQLPPNGQPIVLLADAQTVGGYPRIGQVISADLSKLAQRRAGQHVRFMPIDRLQAQQANAAQRARRARIALAIAGRRR
jgi:biotin-dependent carboxylase-like uncharacterized protein